MHANLHRIQEMVVQGVKECVERNKAEVFRPEVFVSLAMAEKPLTRQELVVRSGLKAGEIEPMISRMISEGILKPAKEGPPSDEQALEFACDADQAVQSVIRARVDEALGRLEPRLAEAKTLLTSCRGQFDGFDWLVAKNFMLRLKNWEHVVRMIRRRAQLLALLDGGDPSPRPDLKPIPIK